MNIFEKVNGRKIVVSYETGAKYRMTYLSPEELQWEALSELSEGEAAIGKEPFWAYELADGIYNINWVEADGMTASQILNFNTSRVSAFLTWAEDGARGGRETLLQHGSFELQ